MSLTRTTQNLTRESALAARRWFVADAEGEVLGRLATRVAIVLRGKHSPSFSPHVDAGDFVVVVNAAKIRLTGRKAADKHYIRHTGYPGGVRRATAGEVLAKHPTRLIREAVVGMLPKNRLGRRLATKL
jgi:large subunit ribosomal protein L13